MKRLFLTVALAVSMVPNAFFAQEASGLSLGKPLKPKRAVGEQYVRFQQGDWVLRCVVAADGADPCEMYQLVVTGEDTAIAELSIFALPAGQPAELGANFIVPLETLLTQPMEIQFAEGVVKQYPYSYCTQVGCFVRLGLTSDEVTMMKKGDVASMAINHMSAPGQPIVVPISLKGFTAVYEKLPKPAAQ